MNKFSELLDSKDLLNKPLIIESESDTKELLYLLGEALIKVIGRYGIQGRPVIAIKGPEGYKEFLGISKQLESNAYTESKMSLGGTVCDRLQPVEAVMNKRVDILIYITDETLDDTDELTFRKVLVPMLTPNSKRAIVLPPLKGSSEAYKQIYEQASTTVVRGLL